jgi:hypothetical protein
MYMRSAIIAASVLMLGASAEAQDITRVSPNGKVTWTYDRTADGVTISREGPHRSWSISRGDGTNPTASASASAYSYSANGVATASAKASTSVLVVTKADGQSIDVAKARAVAKGQVTSTSAVTHY